MCMVHKVGLNAQHCMCEANVCSKDACVCVCSDRTMKTTLGDYYLAVNIITAAQVMSHSHSGWCVCVCVCSLL